MIKRCLITGGAGFIGLHMASWLSKLSYEVYILDNFSRGRNDYDFNNLINKENIKFLKRDITRMSAFDDLNDFDYIYHFAAINGTKNFYNIPDKVLQVGVIGTMNILEWFKTQSKGYLLFSSSSETYAGSTELLEEKFPIPTPEKIPLVIKDPSNLRWSYGGSKIVGEIMMFAYMHAHNLFDRICIIRYHNIYGPRMGFDHVIPNFIERIVKNENPFKIYGADSTRTFCYVDDAVKATHLVIKNSSRMGKITNIGRSDEEIKIDQLANMLFEISGYSVPTIINPAPEGSVKRRCPDISIIEALGFKPKISINDGLVLSYNWYNNIFNKKNKKEI